MALGVQPDDPVFTPGNITLQAKNVTEEEVTSVLVQYTVYIRNNENASNSFNFLYSEVNSGSIYTAVTNLDQNSPTTADSPAGWVAIEKTAIINGLSVSNDEFFYMRWRGRDVSGSVNPRDEIALDNVRLIFNPTAITTYTYNTDFTGSPWTPSSPEGSTNINNIINIIKGDPVISLNTTANTVNIRAGASLTIASDVTLTANVTTLESTSTLYSSLILDGSLTSNVLYERYTNLVGSGTPTSTTPGNDLLSPPLISAGQDFSDFLNLGIEANSDILATSGTLYAFSPYNNATKKYVNYDEVADASILLQRAKGYRAARATGAPDLELTFSGTVSQNQESINITTPVGGNYWNLIGNPYPSYLSSAQFFTPANKAALLQTAVAIYGYNSGTTGGVGTIGNYTIINELSSTNIAPAQGFYVPNRTDTGVGADRSNTITFDPSMRTTIGNDDFILGRNENATSMFRLKVANATRDFATEIYFTDNATLGLDPGYDAAIMGAFEPDLTVYSHLVENNEGINMAIQALGVSDFNDVTIPLGLKTSKGQQITFSIETSTLPSIIEVYLEDTQTNTFTLLNTGDYTFTTDANLNGTGRFFLRTTNGTLSTIDQEFTGLDIYTSQATKEIVVSGKLSKNTMANVFDVQGRLVKAMVLDHNSQQNRMDVSHLSVGVYVVQISSINQVRSEKLILQ